MTKKISYRASTLLALENTVGATLRTPIKRLIWLEQIVGVPVYAKLEFQQHTGSFKFRGALNALKNMEKGQTVIAASAGNHALAVAQAAQQLGVPFRICLPANASRIKREKLI
ncbi:MAG: pyridoxal-phosphate dependent enzyme, partial [Bacillota bacterium]|nr:pyridoxal-phosphate dependent enzyme [Bacillota bacterium]